jgi:O-antigen/teichoic acid export membrane protein
MLDFLEGFRFQDFNPLKKRTPLAVSIGTLGVAALAVVFKCFFNVVLARHTSPAFYGDFCVAYMVFGVFVAVALCGTNVSAVRFLARYYKLKLQLISEHYLVWNVRLWFITTIICLILMVLGLTLYPLLSALHDSSESLLLSILILMVVPLGSCATLMSSFLLSRNHPLISTLMGKFIRYGMFLLVFSIAVFGCGMTINVTSLMVLLVIASLCAVIFCVLCIRVVAPNYILGALPKVWNESRKITRAWLAVSWRLTINQLIFSLICAIDILIIQWFDASQAAVGYYAAAITITSFLWLFPTNVYSVVKPYISTFSQTKKKREKFQKVLDQLNVLLWILLGGCVLLVCVFSATLLRFFGPSYVAAQGALMAFSLGIFVSGIGRPAALIMVYGGHEKQLLRLSMVELILMFVLGAVFTHLYGITAMGIITAVLMSLRSVWIILHVRLHFKVRSALFF